MDDQPGLLYPYRVLDLTGERGQACGKLLADLGADVIKVEPPGGDPARRRGPFVDDESGPDRSLRWLAWNANKRSVSLDLNDAAGRDQFLRLVQSADFVLESFAPGYLAQLRLGYDELAQVNPSLILVSISPFGQSGPYRDYKATDIVCWAMSGFMSIAGEGERPPAQISDNAQSFLNACGDAAIGALIALEQRRRTGRRPARRCFGAGGNGPRDLPDQRELGLEPPQPRSGRARDARTSALDVALPRWARGLGLLRGSGFQSPPGRVLPLARRDR